MGATIVDASLSILAVHQNSIVQSTPENPSIMTEEKLQNRELYKSKRSPYKGTTKDATWEISPHGLRQICTEE
jgi:beta-glucosidase/6-phospho-beta-glucosidase/beta-galactosidase